MKILLISDPRSIHTKTWVEGLQRHDVEVGVCYENATGLPSTELETVVDATFFEAPRSGSLIFDSLKKLRIAALYRDMRSGNTLHQRLLHLGPKIRSIAAEEGYDSIHAHGLTAPSLFASASGFRPFGVSVWGSDVLLAPSQKPYLVPLMKTALHEAAYVHVQGNTGAARILELDPECREKLWIKTWGADTDRFKPGLSDDKLAVLGLPESEWILSFRGLHPLYRTDEIVRAFAELASRHSRPILVIGSEGPEKKRLNDLASELGVDHRVFFTGFLEIEEMAQLFSNSAFFVQFPLSDGASITAMEAMSSGLPVVASDVGDTKTLVEHGVNGFLVPSDDWDSLLNYMDRLIEDSALRRRMGERSRDLALSRHDRDSFFGQLVDRIREILKQY